MDNKILKNFLVDRTRNHIHEVNSKFLSDVTAIAKKYNGYTPTAKSDYVVCSFDDADSAEKFFDALDELASKYPDYDAEWKGDNSSTVMVAETGF